MTRKDEEKRYQGFTRISSCKRRGRKQENLDVNKNISISNQFESLEYQPKEIPEPYHEGKHDDRNQQETKKDHVNTTDNMIEGIIN